MKGKRNLRKNYKGCRIKKDVDKHLHTLSIYTLLDRKELYMCTILWKRVKTGYEKGYSVEWMIGSTVTGCCHKKGDISSF